jgi:3'(2'), 5'-bisphosphate nucleotidase
VAAFAIPACAALIDDLTAIAARAAAAIQRTGAGALHRKADGSPVTAADEAAEAVICEAIKDLAPGIPIVSEERWAQQKPPAPLARNDTYFLVDPLDGTREFIAGRDEFTVNIALISAGVPVLGVITAPALNLAWRGTVGHGAERLTIDGNGQPLPIRTRTWPAKPVIMVSRSHLDARTQAYLACLPGVFSQPCGSSLKFCRLAEGTADLYPRLAPTHDWDVAAGHAIVRAAGGDVTSGDGSTLVYGTANRLIPDFIGRGDPNLRSDPNLRGDPGKA